MIIQAKEPGHPNSIAERSLAFWKDQTADQVRAFFDPVATAKRQFKSKAAFYTLSQTLLANNCHFLDLSPTKLPHFVAPSWNDDFPVCYFSGIPINFMKY